MRDECGRQSLFSTTPPLGSQRYRALWLLFVPHAHWMPAVNFQTLDRQPVLPGRSGERPASGDAATAISLVILSWRFDAARLRRRKDAALRVLNEADHAQALRVRGGRNRHRPCLAQTGSASLNSDVAYGPGLLYDIAYQVALHRRPIGPRRDGFDEH